MEDKSQNNDVEEKVYEIGQMIGKGAFSSVYKGKLITKKNNTKVKEEIIALKQIPIDIDEETTRSINNEIIISSKLNNINIVRMIGLPEFKRDRYIAYEYCNGGDLRKYMDYFGAFDESLIQRIMMQLVNGLSELFQKDVVHHDIKPENILIKLCYELENPEKNKNFQIINELLKNKKNKKNPSLINNDVNNHGLIPNNNQNPNFINFNNNVPNNMYNNMNNMMNMNTNNMYNNMNNNPMNMNNNTIPMNNNVMGNNTAMMDMNNFTLNNMNTMNNNLNPNMMQNMYNNTNQYQFQNNLNNNNNNNINPNYNNNFVNQNNGYLNNNTMNNNIPINNTMNGNMNNNTMNSNIPINNTMNGNMNNNTMNSNMNNNTMNTNIPINNTMNTNMPNNNIVNTNIPNNNINNNIYNNINNEIYNNNLCNNTMNNNFNNNNMFNNNINNNTNMIMPNNNVNNLNNVTNNSMYNNNINNNINNNNNNQNIISNNIINNNNLNCMQAETINKDIKPKNIINNLGFRESDFLKILKESTEYKLSDFGLSKLKSEIYKRNLCGSPLYMSPELFKIDSKLSDIENKKVDIWALGILAYELFFGKRPFEAFSIEELSQMHERGFYFIDLESTKEKKISKEFFKFLNRCLQKDPKKRANVLELKKGDFLNMDVDSSDKMDQAQFEKYLGIKTKNNSSLFQISINLDYDEEFTKRKNKPICEQNQNNINNN